MTDEALIELARLEAGNLDPAAFRHRDHVRLAFEMLRRRPFTDATARFALGPGRMTRKAGRPQAFHETITVAFMAVVAERLARDGYSDFTQFETANPELLDKGLLRRWYDADVQDSAVARATFVLPRPSRGA